MGGQKEERGREENEKKRWRGEAEVEEAEGKVEEEEGEGEDKEGLERENPPYTYMFIRFSVCGTLPCIPWYHLQPPADSGTDTVRYQASIIDGQQ